jgi:hypothetical protein
MNSLWNKFRADIWEKSYLMCEKNKVEWIILPPFPFPMQLFKNTTWKLTEINEKSFDLEKDLQKLTEENLSLIFWLIPNCFRNL